MSANANISQMNRKSIQFILNNHELFSSEDVQAAARKEVYFKRNPEPTPLARLDNERARRFADLAHCNHSNNYVSSYQPGSLLGFLG